MQGRPNDPSAEAPGAEREELRVRLGAWLDVPLTVLAFVMLGLLLVELAGDLEPEMLANIETAQLVIWIIFAAAFLVEFALAPAKMRYLRANWLTAVSVLLPAIRVFRVLRVARVFRGLRVVRVVTALNRLTRQLEQLAAFGRYGQVTLLTAAVTGTAAATVSSLERDALGSPLGSLGEALWWSITTVTTVNAGLDPVTAEARAVAVLLRVFGLAVSGYLTATIAVFLLGPRPAVDAAIVALREEVAALRADVARRRE